MCLENPFESVNVFGFLVFLLFRVTKSVETMNNAAPGFSSCKSVQKASNFPRTRGSEALFSSPQPFFQKTYRTLGIFTGREPGSRLKCHLCQGLAD